MRRSVFNFLTYDPSIHFPFERIYNSVVFSRVSAFCWMYISYKILTLDHNPKKRRNFTLRAITKPILSLLKLSFYATSRVSSFTAQARSEVFSRA